jgi:hypothetical protein
LNFLSHYYHESPSNDPYFVAGVILPDILSNYSHRSGEVVKLFVHKLQDPDSPEQESLQRGVKRHYEIDGYFHESRFFEENTAAISSLIKTRDFSCFEKRLYAVSHVMLEIMLDRKILIEDRAACENMYSMLEKVNSEEITNLIKQNTVASKPEEVREHFDRFRSLKFIYDYTFDLRLVELMNGLNKRLGNKAFSENDRELFKLTIHDIENTLFPQNFPKFPTDS